MIETEAKLTCFSFAEKEPQKSQNPWFFNVELVCVSRSRVIGCICTVNQSIMDKHGLVTERACPIDRCISVIPGKRANSSEVK